MICLFLKVSQSGSRYFTSLNVKLNLIESLVRDLESSEKLNNLFMNFNWKQQVFAIKKLNFLFFFQSFNFSFLLVLRKTAYNLVSTA